MMKAVLKVEISDDKIKQRAMKLVSSLPGVDSIEMNMKDKKLTVTGGIDPVMVVSKLRKLCQTEILTIGPVKVEPKKEEPKKEEPKKGNVAVPYYTPQYQPPPLPPLYDRHVVEEDPNRCVIC